MVFLAKIRSFIRQEIVLCISFAAALLSCFFVPPDAGYLEYCDLRTLALLFSLMVVVAEIRKAGAFARLAHIMCAHCANTRLLGLILVFLCFFTAMFITNDVALLTFVPFSVAVLSLAGQDKYLIRIVVLQTVAANLGSMLTPVGNPQNIFIQSFYNLGTSEFIRITGPVWLASLFLIAALCLTVRNESLSVFLGQQPMLHPKKLWLGLELFAVCLLTVLRILPWPWMLGVVIAAMLLFNRRTLKDADFYLLLTFVCFFVFSGNLARMDAVNSFLRGILSGREYYVSLAASQIISNVPAALLLSGFTDNARALLLGVNVGGLGTPVASLASLISLKLYSHSDSASTGRFLLEFSVINLILLVLLSALCLVLL